MERPSRPIVRVRHSARLSKMTNGLLASGESQPLAFQAAGSQDFLLWVKKTTPGVVRLGRGQEWRVPWHGTLRSECGATSDRPTGARTSYASPKAPFLASWACRHAAETMSARDQRLRVDSLCIDLTARSRAWPRTAPTLRDPLQILVVTRLPQSGRG